MQPPAKFAIFTQHNQHISILPIYCISTLKKPLLSIHMDSEDSVSFVENVKENTTVANFVPIPKEQQEEQTPIVIPDDGSIPLGVTPPKAMQQPPNEPSNNDLSEDVLKAMLAAKKKEKKRLREAERRAARKSTTTSESLPSSGSSLSLPPEKKRKPVTKRSNEKLKRQKLAEDLLKIYTAKKKGHGKGNKKEGGSKKRGGIDGNMDDEEEEEYQYDEDEDEEEESEESTDMEEDQTRSKDEVEYQDRKIARAKRARLWVQENVLNRSGLLTIQKKCIMIHHCDKCKKRQLDRTKELIFKTSIDDIYFLQIELCASCIENNFQLSEQYKRLWIDRAGDKNTANTPAAATSAPRFYISQGEDCTGADDKLMKFKFVWILHQCNTCVQQQRAMAKDIFVRKIDDADMHQLSFVVCGICSVSNTANQSAINRLFNNFKK